MAPCDSTPTTSLASQAIPSSPSLAQPCVLVLITLTGDFLVGLLVPLVHPEHRGRFLFLCSHTLKAFQPLPNEVSPLAQCSRPLAGRPQTTLCPHLIPPRHILARQCAHALQPTSFCPAGPSACLFSPSSHLCLVIPHPRGSSSNMAPSAKPFLTPPGKVDAPHFCSMGLWATRVCVCH